MKKKLILLLVMLTNLIAVNAQGTEKNYRVIKVDKNLNEYPSHYDLSSPLNSFITFKYLESEGKKGKYRTVNSYRIKGFFPKPTTPDILVDKTKKQQILNMKIAEVIYYKDSVAAVLSPYVAPMYIIYYYSLENGEWLAAGEDLGNDLSDARAKFKKKAPNFLYFIKRIRELKTTPDKIDTFINYLKDYGNTPKEFLLAALAKYRIVVYGELHRRKTSWDLWKSILRDKKFVKNVGTVFMELSSDRQKDIDRFFTNKELEKDIILDIFRDVQIYGWYDKGMYEFLIDLWKLNKKLSCNNKIKVVLADEPRPFGSFETNEDLEAHFSSIPDRNEHMANIISETIQSQNSRRNNVFIVGLAHAYKSAVPGIAVGRPKSAAKPTAAAQLVKIFSDKEVFSVFPHMPIISNNGTYHGKIRHGVFDHVFAKLGNKAIAFNLKNCPFGKEPFDGIYEITYDNRVGIYQDNYDAYLFLEPLEMEAEEYFLYELLTDEYVDELKRRAKISGSSLQRWFGVAEETKEAIISHYKLKYENKKRWKDNE